MRYDQMSYREIDDLLLPISQTLHSKDSFLYLLQTQHSGGLVFF